jgi:adenylate cyclase
MQKKTDQHNFDFAIPVIAAVVFAALNFTGFFKSAEIRVYDGLLHLKPSIEQEEAILFVDIDDLAIEKIGIFPWSRDIMADGLILMKEFEARYAVFDIEYTEKSPLGLNSEMLTTEIPQAFSSEFDLLNKFIVDLFTALRMGSISMRDAEAYIEELSGLTEMSKNALLEKVQEIAKDNDIYLGQAARFFENAYFTVNMFDEVEEKTPQDLKDFVLQKIPYEKVQAEYDFPFEFQEMRPAIRPVMEGAKGAGFVNVIVDDDGVRRRIELINEYKDKYFGQLAFSPLLDWLGRPDLILKKDRMIIEQATLPDGTIEDISIPLAEDGRFIINWPKTKFMNSFRHISYYELVLHDRLEESLIFNLNLLKEKGVLEQLGVPDFLTSYEEAQALKLEILQGGDTERIKRYRELRANFFPVVGELLDPEVEQSLVDVIDSALNAEGFPEELKPVYLELKAELPVIFENSRQINKNFVTSREKLAKSLAGSFCILGWIGTSTTDIGVNPFEEEYMNVGTHASVINTIIQRDFIDHLPWWYSAIAGIILALGVTLIIRRLEPLPSIIVGMVIFLAVMAGGSLFFIFTGMYFNLLTPSLSVFLTFLVLTVFKFIRTEQERSYIRNAFGHYLSTEVINNLLNDPDKLKLGGEKRYITAMFTDVKGFSTISEKLDPTDLVSLLNEYLTTMSDTVLDLRGTIDKYEGDAIICFFGAPVEFEDHAARACRAAVLMKKLEHGLNERFLENGQTPNPLLTRIGINTGDMVVGNMGTIKKMDYTIMGNSVNLAARLEGVNKQYGTWILMSQSTYDNGGKEFTTRQMDRVRVVGIDEPVRLYELIDEKDQTDSQTVEAIEIFHQGQEYFENKEWDRAIKQFDQVLKIIPGDGPAQRFSDRCKQYKQKPPPDSWDGVFNLTVK